MPNHYFQFKEFMVHQSDCAMKVSTEACLFGAWIPVGNSSNVLDIGTGTGLLSLMLAQRFGGTIDAVEIDELAFKQARKNFNLSPWARRLSAFHTDILSFSSRVEKQYDLVISNPPFFKGSLKSSSDQKNLALHQSDEFSEKVLVEVLDSVLSEKGEAYILYPEYESSLFRKQAEEKGLKTVSVLKIYNQPDKAIFREVTRVSRESYPVEEDKLNIRIGTEYSSDFISLLRPYYLYL